MAPSGTRVVVGSPGKDLGAADAGGAYVYEVKLGSTLFEATIVSVATLTNPSPAAGDIFGSAVAISDTWVVVGASSDDSGANDAGSAYVYNLGNAAPTTPTLALHNPSPAAGDGFGSSVAVSSTRVVVGAPHDDGGAANSGTAHVYEISSVTPSIPIAVLKSPSPTENEFFGHSVGISGSRAVVGAPGSGPGGTGRAFLYDVSSGTIPVVILTNPNPSPGGGFGSSVAISGSRAVVGTRTSETAYVYDFSSPTPATPVATLHDPNPLAGDHFGAAVAIDGTTATIGRPGNETVPNDAGSTYIFVPGWGLAKATDFGGDWITGSRPYNGVGSYPGYWAGQSTVTLDGDAAEGRLDGPTAVETWMRTTVSGPTTLYFSYRVINLAGAYRGTGGLSLIIDGNSTLISPDMGDFGGDTGWRETSALIPAGVQTVQWKLFYRKGSSNGRAYIDQVSTSADGRPRITDASKRVGTFATPFTWDVPVSSATPATVAADGLPRGLTIDAIAHVISGTPLEAGTFEVTLTAQNTGGQHIAKVVFEIEPGTTTIAEGADAPALVFTQPDPGTAWRGAAGLGRDGVDCVRGSVGPASGMLPQTLSAVVVGPGTLSFWYRTEASHLVLGEHAYLSFSSFQPTVSLSARNWTRATAQLSAGPQTVSWRVYKFGIGSNVTTLSAYLDQITLIPSDAPQIAVEELPQRTNVPAGGSQSFGAVLATTAASRSFTLKNIGLTSLTGLGTSIDGVDAGDFAVTHPPGAPVSGPTGSTSFAIQFSPTSPGPKSATLHIASNDPNVNPFDIILMGTGLELPRQMVEQGAPALFSVDASGATSMKWRKDGIDIPGATGATLSLPSVQPWHIGVYSVWITNGLDSPSVKTVGLLELSGVPTGLWRGLVACYPFNETSADLCRPSKPAILANTSELLTDPQRGGMAHIRGKGWAIPPLPGEPVELQGPGGYLQIPRPPLVDGEPFTVSFVIKEEGFSYWHGESLITMGEGASSNDLISHYWVGSLDGSQETYGGPVVPVQTYTSDFVLAGSAVTLNSPWTGYAAVADGNILRLYRNGQLMGSSPYNKNTLGDSFMGRHWWENGAKYSTRLVAKVDDLRFYNRALTAPEVQQLYSLVQTTPPSGSFESWVLIHGLSGADAGRAGDPDRDRLSNWDEYSFGTSPTDQTESLMKARFAGSTLTLEWLEIAGVRYDLKESSTLLAPWTPAAAIPVLPADQSGVPAGYKRTQATIPIPPAGSAAGNRFFRVEATKIP